MKPVVPSVETGQSIPGYYSHQPSESSLTIHLSLAALDGILSEVMTGFGAIPRRGAEVGGVLVGKATDTEIWIEGFAMADCEHRRGPSYLLSERDETALAVTFESHRKAGNYPVGLFRSNTREENVITDEDRALFRKYFEPPRGAFLLVRPYAAKTSTGTFLVYKNGVLPDSSEKTFPFQRWQLEGETPQRRPLHEPKPRAAVTKTVVEAGSDSASPGSSIVTDAHSAAVATPAQQLEVEAGIEAASGESASKPPRFYMETIETNVRPRGWVWIPLSFILLLLGVLLGFQTALSFYPDAAITEGSSLALGLSATGKDENLRVQWNRASPAIKSAQRGRLDIRDGTYSKTVDLDANSLQTGSVMYPPLTNKVVLRLEVTLKGTTVVTETLEWSKKQ